MTSPDAHHPRPRLELLVAPRTGERIVPVVEVLSRSWEPTAPDPALGAPVAILASSPHAAGLAERLAGPAPVLVWIDAPRESIDLLPALPALVLTPAQFAAPVGVTMVQVPVPGVDGDEQRAVPPFVRERWRRRLGLPPDLVISVGFADSPRLDRASLGTGLAVAAAVAARGTVVLRAMALGAPVATDVATAEHFGLGEGVLVAADPARAAADLAADPVAAASLSRRARAEIETHHDLTPVARAIRDCVDSARRPGQISAISGLEARLHDLGTPAHSVPARRVASAVAGLAGS